MPQAQAGSGAADERLSDFQLSKQARHQLPGALAAMLQSKEATSDFLTRDMRVPAARIPLFQTGESLEGYWHRVLNQFDTENVIETPYRRLFNAVQMRTLRAHPVAGILQTDGMTDLDLQVSQVAEPRGSGCHVIVRTPDERVQQTVRIWLESELLAPRLVWAVHQMTSFEVNDADDEQVRALINGRYARLLVKVIPPGQPDELIDRLRVFDTDDRELAIPQIPVQLTVAELGAAAARFHPAEASTSTRTAGRRRTEFATHIGDGFTQQVPLDGTLLHLGFGDDHRAIIKSVKFQEIRVAFIGASPRWNGEGRRGEIRFSQELDQIRNKARLRHIKLAGEFPHATRAHLAEILQSDPDILHIACHGRDGQLYWEDDDGDPDSVPARWLAESISERAGRRLSGVVLSACDGASVGPSFMIAAREVIAHRGPLPDNLARDFTAKFYDELARMPVLRTAARRADIHGSVLVFPPNVQGDS